MKSRFARVALGPTLSAVLAGCASTPYSPLSPSETAPEMSMPAALPPEVVVLQQEPTAAVGLDHIETEVASIPITTNATPAKQTSIFGRGWIPLRHWVDRCALAQAEKTMAGGTAVYRVTTRGGVCKLTIGSRLAQWNGISLWLGFAPQVVQGEVRIHALDAEKTLMPLAEGRFGVPATTRTVVIDPGHGGSDSGTRGARHELEKIYTLDWALRAERLLTNAGWKVFLTRRTDVEVSLPERVSIAERARADLFVSLHFNSTFPQTQPSGIETYCLTPPGMPSTLARGYADDERAVFPNNAFDTANLAWAYRIHHSLLEQTRGRDDGIKRARFMGVLRYQNRPAILVEGGFLSNAQDAASIQSGAYREALARALATALE